MKEFGEMQAIPMGYIVRERGLVLLRNWTCDAPITRE